MRAALEKCKDITYAETPVKILSAMTKENEKEVAALAEELCK